MFSKHAAADLLTPIPTWCALVGISALLSSFSCSRTVPVSVYPPDGPSAGLPYIPLPEENDLDDEQLDDEPDEDPDGDAETTEPSAGVSSELPPAIPKLSAHASCAEKTCILKEWLPNSAWAKSSHEGKLSPAAIWSHHIPKGNTVVFPRHQTLEVWVLGASGKALATGDDGGAPREVAGWTLVRASGGGVSLRATEDAVVVIALVTSAPSLDQALAAAKAKPWEVRWKKRPASIEFADLRAQAAASTQGGALQVRVAFDGSPRRAASVGALKGGSDLRVPGHSHAKEWEHVALLQGSGVMKLGAASVEMKPGSVSHLPPGVEHSFASAGKEPVVALQLYTPPGPEQRYLKP